MYCKHDNNPSSAEFCIHCGERFRNTQDTQELVMPGKGANVSYDCFTSSGMFLYSDTVYVQPQGRESIEDAFHRMFPDDNTRSTITRIN